MAATYALLAVGATWPLGRFLAKGVATGGDADPLFVASMLEWGYQRLPHALSGFWDPPFYFPTKSVATYSDPLLGIQIFYAPLRFLSGDPIVSFNLAFLAEFALTGYGAFALARHLTGDFAASMVAGALFELLPQKVPHANHLQLIALGLVVLTLLAMHRLLERSCMARSACLAVSFALAFGTSVYNGIFLGTLLIPFVLLAGRPARSIAPVMCAGLTLLSTVLVLLWLHLPMARIQRTQGLSRGIEENVWFSARPADYLSPHPGTLASSLLPFRPPPTTWRERFCYLGLVPMVLAVAAARGGCTTKFVRRYLSLALLALVLSFGPYLSLADGFAPTLPMPYLLLYTHVPGYDALRVPARLSMFVGVFLVPPVAWSVSFMRQRWATTPQSTVALALALVTVHWLDAWPRTYVRPVRLLHGDEDPASVLLSGSRAPAAVVEIPARSWENAAAMLRALAHGHPVVNGYTGHDVAGHRDLFERLPSFPSAETLAALERLRDGPLRVRHVVFRRTPTFDQEFLRARRDAARFPAVRLEADFGHTLLFSIRPREELLKRGKGGPAALPWVSLPLDRLEVSSPKHALEPEGLRLRFLGSMTQRIPMRRGPVRFRASLRADAESDALPPLRLRASLQEWQILDEMLPWNEPVVVETAPLEVLFSARYELELALEASGPLGKRPPMTAWLTCLEISAR